MNYEINACSIVQDLIVSRRRKALLLSLSFSFSILFIASVKNCLLSRKYFVVTVNLKLKTLIFFPSILTNIIKSLTCIMYMYVWRSVLNKYYRQYIKPVLYNMYHDLKQQNQHSWTAQFSILYILHMIKRLINEIVDDDFLHIVLLIL